MGRIRNNAGNEVRNSAAKLLVLCAALLMLAWTPVCGIRAEAAAAKQKLTISHKSASLEVGKTLQLKAAVAPKPKKSPKIIWKSSNSRVISVNASGKVKANKAGKATITAMTSDRKLKVTCTITGKAKAKTISQTSVRTGDVVRTYTRYDQMRYRNGANGCVLTAVAISASGFGKNYSPNTIQLAKASAAYGELYTVKKLKMSTSLHLRAALSLYTASGILTNMGIPNKAVYNFKKEEAIREITEHLKTGSPVIIKTNRNTHGGIRLANGHHALVLISIDDNGYVTFINPMYGKINYSHASNRSVKLKLSDIVSYHMTPVSGNKYKTPYVTSLSAAGGYILLGINP